MGIEEELDKSIVILLSLISNKSFRARDVVLMKDYID